MKPLGYFQELEIIDVTVCRQSFSIIIYDTVNDTAVCACQSMSEAKALLLGSGYFRRPLISGGTCWYCADTLKGGAA